MISALCAVGWHGSCSGATVGQQECRCPHHIDGFDATKPAIVPGTMVSLYWGGDVEGRVLQVKSDVAWVVWPARGSQWLRIAWLRVLATRRDYP